MARQADWLRRRVRDWVAARTTGWISFSRAATEYLLEIGAQEGDVIQVQNTVDEAAFERVEASGGAAGLGGASNEGDAASPDTPGASGNGSSADPDVPSVLYLGQLVERKGLRQLLESARRLQAEGHQFELLIAGDGPERGALEANARAGGLHNVRFLGRVDPDRVPALYGRVDALVLPSLEEVWGLVVNEALLAGVPVAVSRYVGAREVVPDEALFDPLSRRDFDRALLAAVEGRLPAADGRHLMRLDQVAARIVDGVGRRSRWMT